MVEDRKEEIEAECAESHHCHSLKDTLAKCEERVNSGEAAGETCVEEFFDLMECVSHCAAPKIFATLK